MTRATRYRQPSICPSGAGTCAYYLLLLIFCADTAAGVSTFTGDPEGSDSLRTGGGFVDGWLAGLFNSERAESIQKNVEGIVVSEKDGSGPSRTTKVPSNDADSVAAEDEATRQLEVAGSALSEPDEAADFATMIETTASSLPPPPPVQSAPGVDVQDSEGKRELAAASIGADVKFEVGGELKSAYGNFGERFANDDKYYICKGKDGEIAFPNCVDLLTPFMVGSAEPQRLLQHETCVKKANEQTSAADKYTAYCTACKRQLTRGNLFRCAACDKKAVVFKGYTEGCTIGPHYIKGEGVNFCWGKLFRCQKSNLEAGENVKPAGCNDCAHILTGQIIHNSYGAIMFRSGLV